MSQGIRAGYVSSPDTPPANYSRLYPKSDGFWYFKTPAGVEYPLGVALVRAVTLASASSITPDISAYDLVAMENTEALGTLTFNAPTGTPVMGQRLLLVIKSTNAHATSWNAIYAGSSQVALPTTLSGSSKWDIFQFMYNTLAVKWQLLGFNMGF